MGFFNLDEVIEAYKRGEIDSFLAKVDLNDLAIIQHEVAGFATKHNRNADLEALVATIENVINERRTALA